MNRALVTMAPAIDAFTSTYWPARNAASAMISSVRLPSVALSSPPMVSPVLAATDSVARLSKAASGMIAATDSTNSSVCASCQMRAAISTTGTSASSHEQRRVPDLAEQNAQAAFRGAFSRACWTGREHGAISAR